MKAWPDAVDVLIFCGSLSVFIFVGIGITGTLADVFAITLQPQEKTLFRYGGTAVLVVLLLFGTISFLIGGFVARRLKRARARWFSAAVGGIYSLVMVAVSMLMPLERGSLGAVTYVAFQFLFPAFALTIWALIPRHSNSSLQPDRPQADGG